MICMELAASRSRAPSPEAELLLCCLHTGYVGVTDRIQALVTGGVDWELLLRMAGEHGVIPLLARRLERFEDSVPSYVLERLRIVARQSKLRNLTLAGELLSLLKLFERHDIPVVPYKGPVLAATIYGDLASRKPGDLDLLLRPEDVRRARALLLDREYEPMYRLETGQESALFRFEREYGLTHRDTGVDVELQWSVMPRQFSFPLDVEALRGRLQRVNFGGTEVRTISPEDLLLILCVHGSKHFWERLQWVCDVAETLRAHPELDWERLVERASRLGGRRILFLGLLLANELLGAELPAGIVRSVRTEPEVEALAREVYGWLFEDSGDSRELLEGSAFSYFHFRARERLCDRLLYWARTAVTPNYGDWQDAPLPERLFSVYYLLRPLRLARKYGKRLYCLIAR